MSKPLGIEYPGAWYHGMNRGRRGEDYQLFIALVQETSVMLNKDIRLLSDVEPLSSPHTDTCRESIPIDDETYKRCLHARGLLLFYITYEDKVGDIP